MIASAFGARVSVRAAACALPLMVAACMSAPQPTVLRGEGLGSTWTVKLGSPAPSGLDEIQRGIQGRVDDVAHRMSRWDATSNLSAINASSSSGWQTIPGGLLEPLQYALTLAADTGGAFDPTVAPLVDVWGFGTAGRRYGPPTAAAVSAAREHVGFQKVTLDAAALRVRKPAGVQIDLSSMQHGRGADQVAEYLNSLGIRSYLIDVGSEIRARGESPEGGAWHVAVEQPPTQDASANGSSTSAFAEVVSLRDAGIATSGNFRYFFDYDGRRYSHRIDPRTGEPIQHELASVTVIDPACMRADALATALTVLGPVDGMKYADAHGIAVLFIVRSGDKVDRLMTPQFAAYLR